MNKKYVLQANHEIEAMLQKKQSVGSKYYVIHYDRSDDVKITVSVSKKLGDAHIRNYQKRVTKEILRQLLPEIKNVRMLIVVKENSLNLNFSEKEQQIRYVINKLNSNIEGLK